MTKRAEYTFALHEGSLADPGDRNPYAGRSLVLAQLWMRGYMRMMQARIEAGPAMQKYLAGRGGNCLTCAPRYTLATPARGRHTGEGGPQHAAAI
ncbi:ribosome modulation factor [Mycobacterium sp. ML4]